MEQLIHSNESNESKERLLTLSCKPEELCKECDRPPNTNGKKHQRPISKSPRPPPLWAFLFSEGWKQGSDVQITVTFSSEITVTFSEITVTFSDMSAIHACMVQKNHGTGMWTTWWCIWQLFEEDEVTTVQEGDHRFYGAWSFSVRISARIPLRW